MTSFLSKGLRIIFIKARRRDGTLKKLQGRTAKDNAMTKTKKLIITNRMIKPSDIETKRLCVCECELDSQGKCDNPLCKNYHGNTLSVD